MRGGGGSHFLSGRQPFTARPSQLPGMAAPPFPPSAVPVSTPLSALLPQGRWQAAKYLRELAKTSSRAEDTAPTRDDHAEERQPGHCSALRGAELGLNGIPRLRGCNMKVKALKEGKDVASSQF